VTREKSVQALIHGDWSFPLDALHVACRESGGPAERAIKLEILIRHLFFFLSYFCGVIIKPFSCLCFHSPETLSKIQVIIADTKKMHYLQSAVKSYKILENLSISLEKKEKRKNTLFFHKWDPSPKSELIIY